MHFTLHLHLTLKKLIEDIAKNEAEVLDLFVTKETKNCAYCVATKTFDKCRNILNNNKKSPICTFGKFHLMFNFNERMFLKVVNAKNLKLKIIIFVGVAIPLNFVAMGKFAMIINVVVNVHIFPPIQTVHVTAIKKLFVRLIKSAKMMPANLYLQFVIWIK